jgi:hypothetical protein
MISPCRSRRVKYFRFSLFYGVSLIFVSFFCALFFTAIASARDIKLAWDSSNLADGYRLFCRERGEHYDYNWPAWEGSATQCKVFNLDDDATYYFVVRAYNDFGESGDSDEVRYPGKGGGGGGGGCFIATPVLGIFPISQPCED